MRWVSLILHFYLLLPYLHCFFFKWIFSFFSLMWSLFVPWWCCNSLKKCINWLISLQTSVKLFPLPDILFQNKSNLCIYIFLYHNKALIYLKFFSDISVLNRMIKYYCMFVCHFLKHVRLRNANNKKPILERFIYFS